MCLLLVLIGISLWLLIKVFDNLWQQVIYVVLVTILLVFSFIIPAGEGAINVNHYQYKLVSRHNHLYPRHIIETGLKRKLSPQAVNQLMDFQPNPYSYYHDDLKQGQLIQELQHQTNR